MTATYQQLLAQSSSLSPASTYKPKYSLAYWLMLTVLLVVMLVFLMTVIAPSFKAIASEFGIQLPWAFQLFSEAFDQIVAMAGFWIVAVLAIIWLALSGTSRRYFRRTVAGRLFSPVAQSRMVELLRLLANAIEAGRPLPGALSTLARYHFDRNLRQKLLYSRNEVEQGVDVWQSLSDAKLLTPQESHALATAPSNGLRAWTLRRLALVKQSRNDRRVVVLFAFLEPAVVLGFAAIVLWICYAFFGFIAGITSSLS